MTNAFSKLEVEDPDVLDETQEDDTNATSTFEEPLDSIPAVNPGKIEENEEEKEADFFFTIHSFVTNVHEIRDIVQETWFEYKDGKTNSVKASLIVNTAIDLVRHVEAEFDIALERPNKYPAKKFSVCKSKRDGFRM
jgi:hypothetical protein